MAGQQRCPGLPDDEHRRIKLAIPLRLQQAEAAKLDCKRGLVGHERFKQQAKMVHAAGASPRFGGRAWGRP